MGDAPGVDGFGLPNSLKSSAGPITSCGPTAEFPEEIRRGLEQLETSRPLWPVGGSSWVKTVYRVKAFARGWDRSARAAGWPPVLLYGLHRHAPYANLAGMGAAFLLAGPGWHVLSVSAEAIAVASCTGGRLRVLRREPDPDAVLAWSLAAGEAPPTKS